MTLTEFWGILDKAREDAGGWEEMLDPLVAKLASLKESEIFLWENIFQEYQSLSCKRKLWAAAFVINGGCSDDGFDYFRGWLTAQGRDVFLDALSDPDSLSDLDCGEGDAEYEDILGAALKAYFKKKGDANPDFDKFYGALEASPFPDALKRAMAGEISYADDIDIEWDEDGDALAALLPRLAEIYEP
jgi:hypothetical protein